ncbi:uncharacterized protein [Amphiura filiformis]|uniref:uncharacterized protein n=1 Tax=Amphiura filiformis TaxID=82378 RepID=UPI003B216927
MKCYTFKVLLEQLIGPGAYVTSIFVLGPAKTPMSYINKCNITALFLNSNISVPDDVFEHLLIDYKMCVKGHGLQMKGLFVEEKERNDVCYIEDEPFHKWLTSNERMDTQSQPTPSFKQGFDIDEAATHQSCFLKRYGDVHVLGILHEKSLFIKSALDGTAPIINGFFQEEEYQSNLAASFETDINDSGLENDIKVKSAAGGDQSQTKEGSQPQRESPNHVCAAGDRSVRRRLSGNGIGGGGDGGKKPPGGGDSKRIGGCGGSPQQEQQQQGDQEENEAADVDRGGDVIQQEQQHQVHQEENEAADVNRSGDVIQQEQQQQADQDENKTADVDRGGDVIQQEQQQADQDENETADVDRGGDVIQQEQQADQDENETADVDRGGDVIQQEQQQQADQEENETADVDRGGDVIQQEQQQQADQEENETADVDRGGDVIQQEQQQQADQEENETADVDRSGDVIQQEQQQQADQEENETADVDRGGDVIQQEQQQQADQEENETADVDRGGDVIQQEQQADQDENETADVDRGGDVIQQEQQHQVDQEENEAADVDRGGDVMQQEQQADQDENETADVDRGGDVIQQEQQHQVHQEENEAADVDRSGDVIQQEQQHQVHQEENEAADVDRSGDVIQQEQQQADQDENETADVDRGGDVMHHNEAPVPNVDDGQDIHQDMQNPLILEARSVLSTLQLHRLTAQHQCEIRFRVVQRGTSDDCIQILDPNEMPDQYSEVAIRLDIPIHHCILDLETAVTTGALEKVKELLDKIKKRIFYCWICQQDVQPDELYNPALFYKCGHSFWDACRFAIRYCPVCREKRSCVLYLPEGFKRAFGLKDTTSKDMEDGVKRSVHVGIRLEEENAMVKVSRNHLLSTKADNGRVDKHQYPLPARQREVPRGPPDDIYIPPDPEFILPDRDGPEEAAGLDGRPPWNPRQALLNPEMSPVGPNLSPPYNYPIGDLPDYQTENNRDSLQRYLIDAVFIAESPPESDEDEQPLGAEGGVSIEGLEASIQEQDGLSNEDLEEEEAHVEEEAKKDGHNREDSMRDSGVD